MSRIAGAFALLQAQNRTALIPFVTAGDPRMNMTVELMHAMVEAGADIIELGIPFSDPMAEGPVIQRASERALENQVSLHDVLQMVVAFRETNNITPVVLMGYLNPIEVMGYQAFAEAANQAGADGVITVDLPPEEGEEYIAALKSHKMDPIFLLSPTSTEQRMAFICEQAGGFVYYVSLKGVTGAASLDIPSVEKKLDQIRVLTEMPIGVGFGIKDATTAAAVAQHADAVVVGSALVKKVEENIDKPENIIPEIVALLSSLRKAMDAVKK